MKHIKCLAKKKKLRSSLSCRSSPFSLLITIHFQLKLKSSEMTALSPIPAFEDLKITFQEQSLVFPSQETQKKSIFLSNIDQILNYNIPTAHFFKPNPDFPPENVAEKLRVALERVLVSYEFMAGRLKLNQENSRLEIDCNEAGAGFVVASSEFSLDEIMEFLVHPNLGYRQLAIEKIESLGPGFDQPLCVFQV